VSNSEKPNILTMRIDLNGWCWLIYKSYIL
jgi:hypothetical protein